MGAALGQVSGSVDRIVTLDRNDRDASWEKAQQECREAAILSAVKAGAERSSVEVVDVSEVPVPYVGSSGLAVRMRVRAVGDLQSCEQPIADVGGTQDKGGVAKQQQQQVSTAVVGSG